VIYEANIYHNLKLKPRFGVLFMSDSYNLGRLGEKLAAGYLSHRGYEIIATNKQLGHKEIDIIAKKDDLFIVFEVKTARSDSSVKPEEQLNTLKIKRLKKASMLYCFEKKISLDKLRVDLLAISLNYEQKMANIKHFKNIF